MFTSLGKREQLFDSSNNSSGLNPIQWLKCYDDPTPPDQAGGRGDGTADTSEVMAEGNGVGIWPVSMVAALGRHQRHQQQAMQGLDVIKSRVARMLSSGGRDRLVPVAVSICFVLHPEYLYASLPACLPVSRPVCVAGCRVEVCLRVGQSCTDRVWRLCTEQAWSEVDEQQRPRTTECTVPAWSSSFAQTPLSAFPPFVCSVVFVVLPPSDRHTDVRSLAKKCPHRRCRRRRCRLALDATAASQSESLAAAAPPTVRVVMLQFKFNIPTLRIDYFSRTSDELILSIFKWLPKTSLAQCSLVCRRWYCLTQDESLWKRVDFGNKRVTETVLHNLLRRGLKFVRLAKAQIKSSGLGPGPSLSVPKPLEDFTGDIYALQYLDLSMAVYVNVSVLNGILMHCRHLVALSLEGALVDDLTCTYIGANTHLKLLNLALSSEISSTGIKAIVAGCTELQELNVGWTQLSHNSVQCLCRGLPQTLQRINLSGCREATLFDVDIAHVVVNCPFLTEVDISDCSDLSAAAVTMLIKGCGMLERLSCSRCYNIDPFVYTSCKSLKELNIFGTIREDCMPLLQKMLPKKLMLNINPFSTIARPTVGIRRTSIWGHRVRDE